MKSARYNNTTKPATKSVSHLVNQPTVWLNINNLLEPLAHIVRYFQFIVQIRHRQFEGAFQSLVWSDFRRRNVHLQACKSLVVSESLFAANTDDSIQIGATFKPG